MAQQRTSWFLIIIVILLLGFFSMMVAGILALGFSDTDYTTGNVAVIQIHGPIMVGGSTPFGSDSASSQTIVKQIKRAQDSEDIKAIIFDINSPGGTPVASNEIGTAIKASNKTTVSWIREVGASGAYWISSATDYIIADELSVTGSIGVLGSTIELAGLLERFNMSYRRFVAGEKKDTGTPYREMTFDEELFYQSLLDKMHDRFIDEVAMNRDMSVERVRELATGEIFLGAEALNHGLVDATGGKDDAIEYIESTLDIEAELVVYQEKASLLDVLTSVLNQRSFYLGKGMASHQPLLI